MFRQALVVGLLLGGGLARAEEKEPPITGEGARAVFLRAAHARIHPGWNDSFLRRASEHLSPANPLNDPAREAVVGVTMIPDGTLVEIRVEKSSGSSEFDAAALGVFPTTLFPQPPDEALSDDGRTYLRWTFARDRRACSQVEVILKEGPLGEALPRLLGHNRDREALRRVRAQPASALEGTLSLFARAWLERSLDHQPVQSLQAAIGLAGAGDASGEKTLRAALARGERLEPVTAALLRLKLPLPAGSTITPPPPPEDASTEVLLRQLRKGPHPARLAAAQALAGHADAAARQALVALARQNDPELRMYGAAALGTVERATLIAAVGTDGRDGYRALVRGAGRNAAAEWLLATFERLTAPVQIEVLSEWLWGSRPHSTLASR
jgi:TonB family protein